MSDELTGAIAELRRVTPANDPWDGRDFNSIPAPIDDAICVILNAVLSGKLTHDRLIAEAVAAERERCAKWHDREAEVAMNSLHCGSENSEYRAANRLHDFHKASAAAIRKWE